jgi:hypothetical protein
MSHRCNYGDISYSHWQNPYTSALHPYQAPANYGVVSPTYSRRIYPASFAAQGVEMIDSSDSEEEEDEEEEDGEYFVPK